MKYLNFLIFIILFTSASYTQTYKKVKIYFNDKTDIQKLNEAGLDFDHLHYDEPDNSVQVFLNDYEFSRLSQTSYRYDILIDDWQKYYDSHPGLSESVKKEILRKSKMEYGVSGFRFGSMGGFYTLKEIIEVLDSMKLAYPGLITSKTSIGTSVEERNIYVVKISDNPDADEDEPEVLYTALHHAREPESMMQMMYFMFYLLENYDTESSVKYLVDNRELFFIPVLNPDGYEYNRITQPNGGGFWRKNRRVLSDGQVGIDLNRNYGPQIYWNAQNGGSSTLTVSETYRGSAPFSEPETQAIKNFLTAHNIKVALNYHSYSNLLIYPYGALIHETPDSAIFREFARDMTFYNNYAYGTDQQTVRYSTRGNSDDYFYDGDTISNGGKIFAMTPEVGSFYDGFWPSQNRIIPIAAENLYPNLYYAWVAGDYVRLAGLNLTKNYFQPGENINLSPSFKNKGLKDASNITVSLTSMSPYFTVNDGPTIHIGSLLSRSILKTQTAFNISISTTAPFHQNIKLLFIMSLQGIEMSRDTVSVPVEGPVLPVELQSFIAAIRNSGVILEWSTANETNNNGFEIERTSLDMSDVAETTPSSFQTIGFVKGNGTITDFSKYSYVDKNPLEGKSVYRLKQIDFDGTYKYSGTVEVNFSSGYSLEQNYPNPFNPVTYFEFRVSPASGSGFVSLKIFDVLGNEIKTLVKEEKEPGKYVIEFDASLLASGVYYYTLTSGSFTSTKKLVLLK